MPADLLLADLQLDPILVHRDHAAVQEPGPAVEQAQPPEVVVEKTPQRPATQEEAEVLDFFEDADPTAAIPESVAAVGSKPKSLTNTI